MQKCCPPDIVDKFRGPPPRKALGRNAPVSESTSALERLLAPRYRLADVVGRGGMAIVYRAHDVRLKRDVAIKVLSAEVASAVNLERFQREITIAAVLQHPHIVPVFDAGGQGDILYYVMPLIVGETLRDRLKRDAQMSLDQVVSVAREVGAALSHAHAHGIVHRDIKPENILLSEDSALVTDFGIARALTQAGVRTLTEGGVVIGTPAYMSPEQAGGDEVVDGRTDIYAFGCVVYEMLAGEPPFSGRTVQAILARQLTERPPSLRIVRPSLPAGVQLAVERALAKEPVDRFATATGFVTALTDGRISAEMPETERTQQRFTWPLRWRTSIGLLATATLAIGLGARWLFRAAPELDGNRVVVFPLVVPGATDPAAIGEQVALLIGSALEHTEPLRWLDGSALRRAWAVERPRRASNDAAQIARNAGARFYLDGAVVAVRDSNVVIVRLHDAVTDSLVSQESASGGGASMESSPQLALRAVTKLLPRLLPTNGRVDLSYLADRPPAAIADWLQGEREYAHGGYVAALDHMHRALGRDSAMGVAALKGAQAAAHLEDYDAARQLLDIALRRDRQLPLHHRALARGLQQLLAGAADAALASFAAAQRADSTWSEPWMWIGETYYHLLPSATRLDALAENAFGNATRLSADFAPALFHLTELAVLRDDLPAARVLLDRFRRASPDSDWVFQAELTVQCAANGPAAIDWVRAADRASGRVVTVAHVLGSGARHRACARSAYAAVLARDTAAGGLHFINRWSALKGLDFLLVQEGRANDAARLLDSARASGMEAAVSLHIVNAASGATASEARAADAMATLRANVPIHRMSTTRLRYVSLWSWHQRDTARLDSVERRTRIVADSSGVAADRLVHDAAAARLAVLRGDTVSALRILRQLRAVAEPGALAWDLFAGQSAERLLLAQLQLTTGAWREAAASAEVFDSPHTQIDALHFTESLAIRARAAARLGDRAGEAAYMDRLRRVARRDVR